MLNNISVEKVVAIAQQLLNQGLTSLNNKKVVDLEAARLELKEDSQELKTLLAIYESQGNLLNIFVSHLTEYLAMPLKEDRAKERLFKKEFSNAASLRQKNIWLMSQLQSCQAKLNSQDKIIADLNDKLLAITEAKEPKGV